VIQANANLLIFISGRHFSEQFFLLLRSIFCLSMVLLPWDRSEFELYQPTSSERLKSIFGVFPWIDLSKIDLRSIWDRYMESWWL